MVDDTEHINEPLNLSKEDLEACFLKAVEQNNSEDFYLLLNEGLSPNFVFTKYNGIETTPLREAIARGHDDMVQTIIDKAPKTIDELSLFTALTAKDGNFNRQTLQLLLTKGAKISDELIKKTKDTLYLEYMAVDAVETERMDLLEQLLNVGFSLDFQVTDYLDLKTSPLDRAIALNKLKFVVFLLKSAKVNPNTPINGFSPLLQAIDQKRDEIVSILAKFGAIFYEPTI